MDWRKTHYTDLPKELQSEVKTERQWADRAYWKNKMWEIMQLDFRVPQTVILSDGIIDHINVPLEEVVLMKNTGKTDIQGKFVYEGDFIESHQGTQILDMLMLVKYGAYEAYCPADDCYMDNVGFYVEAVDYPQMPLGPLSDYAKVIGNMCENADLLKKYDKNKTSRDSGRNSLCSEATGECF